MKFFADQDVYAATDRLIRSLGHDVISAAIAGLSNSSDLELLRTAQEQSRILVTRDRDFGNLVFVRRLEVGVIYLRILPSTLATVHKELVIILETYSENELMNAFVVVEPARHRFRKMLE